MIPKQGETFKRWVGSLSLPRAVATGSNHFPPSSVEEACRKSCGRAPSTTVPRAGKTVFIPTAFTVARRQQRTRTVFRSESPCPWPRLSLPRYAQPRTGQRPPVAASRGINSDGVGGAGQNSGGQGRLGSGLRCKRVSSQASQGLLRSGGGSVSFFFWTGTTAYRHSQRAVDRMKA